jgi:hypothetical protein
MAEENMFFRGTPLGPEVSILSATFKPEDGVVVEHSEIERALELKRATVRYQTVIQGWKKQLKTRDRVYLQSVRGIGYKFLSAGEAVEAYVSEAGKGIKQIARSAMDIASVPRERLDSHQCGRADAAQSLLAKVSMDLRHTSKALDAKPSSAAQVAPNILGN